MHLLHMSFRNARQAGSGELRINRSGNGVAKWTILDEGPRGLEMLRLMSAACGGTRVISRLDFDFATLCRDPDQAVQVELVLALFCSLRSRAGRTGADNHRHPDGQPRRTRRAEETRV